MEEYVKEAPQTGSLSNKRLEYRETEEEPQEDEKPAQEEIEKPVEQLESKEEIVELREEPESPVKEEAPKSKSSQEPTDLLGFNYEVNPEALKLEESNALALAILQPGDNTPFASNALVDIGKTSGWELALVMAPSNTSKTHQATDTNMAGGFDKLLLDSLYEDDASRRTMQLHSAGYNTSYGYDMTAAQTPFDQQHDPFAMSSSIAPPTNVQMALMSQQEQMMMMQQQQAMTMGGHNPYTYAAQFATPQPMQQIGPSNPFGDPFVYPQKAMPPHGNDTLI